MKYWLGLDNRPSRALLLYADGSLAGGVTAPHQDIHMERPLARLGLLCSHSSDWLRARSPLESTR